MPWLATPPELHSLSTRWSRPLSHSTQVKQFQPALVSVRDGAKAAELKELIKDAPRQPEVLVGEEGICAGGQAGLQTDRLYASGVLRCSVAARPVSRRKGW